MQESLIEVEAMRQEGKRQVKLGDLAVNAKRLKPEDKAIGADLTTETVDEPAAYRISSPDDPAWRKRPHRQRSGGNANRALRPARPSTSRCSSSSLQAARCGEDVPDRIPRAGTIARLPWITAMSRQRCAARRCMSAASASGRMTPSSARSFQHGSGRAVRFSLPGWHAVSVAR